MAISLELSVILSRSKKMLSNSRYKECGIFKQKFSALVMKLPHLVIEIQSTLAMHNFVSVSCSIQKPLGVEVTRRKWKPESKEQTSHAWLCFLTAASGPASPDAAHVL